VAYPIVNAPAIEIRARTTLASANHRGKSCSCRLMMAVTPTLSSRPSRVAPIAG
jgi:hypothetical protein